MQKSPNIAFRIAKLDQIADDVLLVPIVVFKGFCAKIVYAQPHGRLIEIFCIVSGKCWTINELAHAFLASDLEKIRDRFGILNREHLPPVSLKKTHKRCFSYPHIPPQVKPLFEGWIDNPHSLGQFDKTRVLGEVVAKPQVVGLRLIIELKGLVHMPRLEKLVGALMRVGVDLFERPINFR